MYRIIVGPLVTEYASLLRAMEAYTIVKSYVREVLWTSILVERLTADGWERFDADGFLAQMADLFAVDSTT